MANLLRAFGVAAAAQAMVLITLPPHAAAQEALPATDLFSDREARQPALSPDGDWIGFAQRDHVGDSLLIMASAGGEWHQLLVLPRGDLRAWQWAENGEQLIVTSGGTSSRQVLALDINRDPDLDSSGRITFHPRGGGLTTLTPEGIVDSHVITGDPWNRDEILIAVTAPPPIASGVRRVNTRTGASRLIEETTREGGQGSAPKYFAAAGLELRAAMRPTSSGGLSAIFRDSVRETWLELGRWELVDAQASRVMGITTDGRTFYVADSRDRPCAALFALHVDDNSRMRYDLLAEHASADLAEVAVHPRSGHAQAAAFDGLRREWIVIDHAVREDWTILEEFAGDASFSIVSRDRADHRWIIEVRPMDRPPFHALYDRMDGTIERLFDDATPAGDFQTAAIWIAARDGVTLPCYLTLPREFAGTPVPTVLFLHDGPFDRAGPGFDPLHHWLASRGFAVLSVNFRGSAGFGKEFARAGHREWAGAIQDDIIDAALWLIEKQIADPDRIAVIGEGFGGYSALKALSATPEFFAAGIAVDPIVDLEAIARKLTDPRARALFHAQVAPLDDEEQLVLVSPIHDAEKITRPLLVARTYGESPCTSEAIDRLRTTLEARRIPFRSVDVADTMLPSRNARWVAILDEVARLLQSALATTASAEGAREIESR